MWGYYGFECGISICSQSIEINLQYRMEKIYLREYTQYYKDGKPCYKGFTVHGYGTSTFYKEIKNNLSDSIIYGYGYYGHDLLQENGMYFIGTTTGNSCD